MASALVTPSLLAELPDFQEASLQEDPDLALLVEKYEALVRTRSLTSQELAALIASDKSEKAKFLGIRESSA